MTTLRLYQVTTSDRSVVILAENEVHAHRMFTGQEWPPGVPPVPTPANQVIPNSGGQTEATPDWQRWYNEEFLPRRAYYPVLRWEHGECMYRVEAYTPPCPSCGRPLTDATGDWQCHTCQQLWPITYFQGDPVSDRQVAPEGASKDA